MKAVRQTRKAYTIHNQNGRVLKKNREGRDKIVKKILNTTIFCYTNN
jgi:hypothetical protein